LRTNVLLKTQARVTINRENVSMCEEIAWYRTPFKSILAPKFMTIAWLPPALLSGTNRPTHAAEFQPSRSARGTHTHTNSGKPPHTLSAGVKTRLESERNSPPLYPIHSQVLVHGSIFIGSLGAKRFCLPSAISVVWNLCQKVWDRARACVNFWFILVLWVKLLYTVLGVLRVTLMPLSLLDGRERQLELVLSPKLPQFTPQNHRNYKAR